MRAFLYLLTNHYTKIEFFYHYIVYKKVQKIINPMKYLTHFIAVFILAVLSSALFSCGGGFKELKPVSNENNLKVKLEISVNKTGSEPNGAFTLRITNESDGDYIRCSFKFDNKYEHVFEYLIDNSSGNNIVLNSSILKAHDTHLFEFSSSIDNYRRFGITDKTTDFVPSEIEFTCLEGKVVWKIQEK